MLVFSQKYFEKCFSITFVLNIGGRS